MNDSSSSPREIGPKPDRKAVDPAESHSHPDGRPSLPLQPTPADSMGCAPVDNEPVVAELVTDAQPSVSSRIGREANLVLPRDGEPGRSRRDSPTVDVASEFQNMSAVGGRGFVGVGNLVDYRRDVNPLYAINAFVALGLGLWGLNSRRSSLAMAGIVLALLGVFFSFLGINERLAIWLASEPSI